MSRRQREWGEGGPLGTSSRAAAANHKAALASAYQELGKELCSSKIKMVGTYTLGRPIGEGTFGKVRMGTHRLTGTRVAIKQVPKAHSASLTREIHHHRRLHHPNVMQLYEVIATEAHIWMVSELCAGGELYDYLVERGTMPEAEARRLFGQLCLALAYIHGKGIVHRDLKLENVLLDERCNIKLGDFGFTREFERNKLMDTFCGTTGYAAPEMLAGKKYTGEEVDIWSLGIILYALLCGALPFDDDDDEVMKDKILKGDYEIPDCISEESRDLIKSILVQDPTARPSIKAILGHAWFAKTIHSRPMSPVDENEALGSHSGHGHVAGDEAQEEQGALEPASAPAVLATAPTLQVTAEAAAEASTVGGRDSSDGQSRPDPASAHNLHATAAGFSEASFYSAQSDSSSDRRSTQTATTTPTTEGDEGEQSTNDEDEADQVLPLDLGTGPSGRIAIHRNESQSTIRREGSTGSNASRKATAVGGGGKVAPSLPTHDETPSSPDGRPSQDLDAPLVPRTGSSTLVKRGSQSSSRGHHRTPSRTKRRSVSSNGLSDHHPPHPTHKPVDYLSQLELAGTPLFTTETEQNLLHQLSTLGLDVGQIVHSVVTDACDATGAMWWILKVKYEQRMEQEQQVSYVSPPSVPHILPPPPPLPPKDPARQTASTTSSPMRTGPSDEGPPLAVAAAALAQRIEAGRLSPIVFRVSADRGGRMTPVGEPEGSIATSSSLASSLGKEAAVLVPAAPATASITAVTATAATPSPSGKSRRPESRHRASSFSTKLGSVLGLDKKDSPSASTETAIIGDVEVPLERSKSPVGTLFGKRNGGQAALSKVRDAERKKGGSAGSGSQPASPAPSQRTVAGSSSPSKAAAAKDKQERTDPQRVKAADAPEAGPSGGKGSDKTSANGKSVASAARSGPRAGTPTSKGAGKPLPSQSVETFSTLSSQREGDPPTKARRNKGTAKSSFLSTVRTWLGSEKEQNRRNKKSHPASSAGQKVVVRSGGQPGSTQYSISRSGSMRSRNGTLGSAGLMAAAAAAGQGSSVATAARSPRATQRGSVSRRSSSGSVQLQVRPVNLRRQSAGSITPTATVFGESIEAGHSTALRLSRPSSSHSHGQARARTLHGKSGSTGSSKSTALRHQQSSLRSLHSRRLSHDGGTVVLRHRVYGSGQDRARSESGSRPPSLYGALEDAESDSVVGGLGIGTRRGSIDIDSRSAGGGSASGQSGGYPATRSSSSVFVAHKSRSPYKHPLSNPALHKTPTGRSSLAPHANADLPAAGTGTWRRSWGRPPPSWAGPVDDRPSRWETAAAAAALSSNALRPKLRDVFADRDDLDWEDEEDEPIYSGGLGQLDSIKATSAVGSGWSSSGDSPAFGSGFTGTPVKSSFSGMPMSGGVLGSGRYASVRTMFQPPVLGRETAPRILSATINADGAGEGSSLSVGSPGLGAGGGTTAPKDGLPMGAGSPGLGSAAPSAQGLGVGAGSRIRAAAAPTFKSAPIEEEEEDE